MLTIARHELTQILRNRAVLVSGLVIPFAVSASLMLFFHPKAALPSAIGLIVHSLYFQFLVTQPRKVPETRTAGL